MKVSLRGLRPRYSLRFALLGFAGLAVLVAGYRDPIRARLESLLAGLSRPVTLVITGPQAEGIAVAIDPPSPKEILQALTDAGIATKQPPNLRMVVEPISTYTDPPQVSSTLGRSQLHHAHYKCILLSDDGTSTVYIDHNHRCVW